MKNLKKKTKEKPSQKEIADALGVSAGFLSKILSGKRNCSFDLGVKISEYTKSELYIWLTGNMSHSEIRKKLLLNNQ